MHAAEDLDSSEVLGRPVREDEFEAVMWGAVHGVPAAGRHGPQDCSWFEMVLCPSLNTTAPPAGTLTRATGSVHAFFDREFAVTGFTTAANITGWASIQLPVGEVDGLPAGVQLMAPGKAVLLSLAAQLEVALPWADRHSSSG